MVVRIFQARAIPDCNRRCGLITHHASRVTDTLSAHSHENRYQSPSAPLFRKCRGFLAIDMAIAIALLLLAVLPVAFSWDREQRLFRAYYLRAVAMEILDGEMEALAAGGWKAFPEGKHEYQVHAASATNLGPGRFIFSRQTNSIRLEWMPEQKGRGGPLRRELPLP